MPVSSGEHMGCPEVRVDAAFDPLGKMRVSG